ncbi:Altered inheritance of mitochondria protein 23 mitochondrial [Bienertia sinuspersici]
MLEEMSCSPPHISLSQVETDVDFENNTENEVLPEVILVSNLQPQVQSNGPIEKDKGEQSLAKPNAFCRSRLRARENTLVTCDGDESDNESEEDYVPPIDFDEESDNADDEIEEDSRELLLENYVDSGWEPFRQCAEIYEDDHFKDALRDYFIQEGFALVVKKADNERYTAECADIRCNWRIHASKLADEHTWAIKNIRQEHLCDLNLTNNPMVNCEWVASKLLEDIRACPDVKGSYVNELLSNRALVGVDGCHLKGNYGGILLSAVALDDNNEIFPVAIAVVDSRIRIGIDPSLDGVWPTFSRRYCARHLCKNFKEYPGVLMHKLFWGVTNSYSLFTFRKSMKQVAKFAGLGAVKWLKEVGPLERWARWMFNTELCSDENTNNFVESFNSTIGVDRTYPILNLLEGNY